MVMGGGFTPSAGLAEMVGDDEVVDVVAVGVP
jgi:hypothetical protein